MDAETDLYPVSPRSRSGRNAADAKLVKNLAKRWRYFRGSVGYKSVTAGSKVKTNMLFYWENRIASVIKPEYMRVLKNEKD